MSDPVRYTRTAIALHWLIAVVVVGQFAWGWWMLDIPKQPVGPRVDAFNLHKSVGLTILTLMIVRMIWRATHPAPALPLLPPWQTRLAQGTHIVLYAALFVMPIAGYLGSVASGYPPKFFGVVLPVWGSKNVALKDFCSAVHYVTAWMLAGAVVLHLAGAFNHAFVKRDRLLARMGLGSVR